MPNPGEEPRLSKDFLLGQLRAALRPSRISVAEVRRLLRVASEMGYNPVELYREAVKGRPEAYDPPPLLTELLPKDAPKEVQLDLALGKVLSRKASTESEPSKPKEE